MFVGRWLAGWTCLAQLSAGIGLASGCKDWELEPAVLPHARVERRNQPIDLHEKYFFYVLGLSLRSKLPGT